MQSFLIILFSLLILMDMYNKYKPKSIKEGFDPNVSSSSSPQPATEYKEYVMETKDPLFLAMKNAANISYLKTQITDISSLTKQLNDLQTKVTQNTNDITMIKKASSQEGANIGNSITSSLKAQ
jgi:hypothetical protein